MKTVDIQLIDSMLAKDICLAITGTLPEWFGIPEANERYAQGMLNRVSFAACVNHDYVGLITLEFPYPNNANIYWIAVSKSYHGKHIGRKLLQAAEQYCHEHGYVSLTVETLSPKQNDENYLKTWYFYEKSGFKPLFEMHTYDPHNLMVYMQKHISLDDFTFVDLTHTLSPDIPGWDSGCGFQHKIELDYSDCTTDVKFRVQSLQMLAGMGTHMDAPVHCIPDAASIADIRLESLITPCRVIDVSARADAQYSMSVDDIKQFENEYGIIPKGSFVIVYTGWDQWWHEPEKYRNNLIFPCISRQAAEELLSRNIAGIGIDTLSPDCGNSNFPVHQAILSAGKYIVENIANARQMNSTGDYSLALPIKIQGGTEAPVRLIGLKRK